MVPGSVVWRRVTKPKEGVELSRFKAVENTNYAVDLASANGLRIVGIQGADIVDGTKTLVLGLVWQLMRLNIDQTLASLSRNGKGVTDLEIVKWANEKVKSAGKTSSMRSLRDPSLGNGHFYLDLVDSLRPGIVDQALVEEGKTWDECILNGTSHPFPHSYGLSCLVADLLSPSLVVGSSTGHLGSEEVGGSRVRRA